MTHLSKQRCIPCEGGMPPMAPEEISKQRQEISAEWNVLENKKLNRKFSFKDFKEALTFVNNVGEIAEKEGHHPDIEFGWGYANITLTTHAVSGLSINDFILAAKIDKIA